jgi:hypothetical protein
MLDAKIKIINERPALKNVREVRQFYGFPKHRRRFTQNCGQVSTPLAALFKEDGDVKKNHPVYWNAGHQLSFECLKKALTTAFVLHQP